MGLVVCEYVVEISTFKCLFGETEVFDPLISIQVSNKKKQEKTLIWFDLFFIRCYWQVYNNILICIRIMVDCAIFMYANENLNLFYNMLFQKLHT